jgi:hypothetical protein
VSDRADELRRQRDLLREHLAWIEKELAAEEGSARPQPGVAYAPPGATPPPLEDTTGPDDSELEAMLEEFRPAPVSISSNAKLGCIAYFALAMVLLIGCLAAFYFHVKASRGH